MGLRRLGSFADRGKTIAASQHWLGVSRRDQRKRQTSKNGRGGEFMRVWESLIPPVSSSVAWAGQDRNM